MDKKSEELLLIYKKEVQQLARKVYLEAKAITREINESKVNPEDKDRIKIHIIHMLTDMSFESPDQ